MVTFMLIDYIRNHPHTKRSDIPVQSQQCMYRPNPTPQETEVKQEPDNEQFKLMQDFMNQDILKNIVTRISKFIKKKSCTHRFYRSIFRN